MASCGSSSSRSSTSRRTASLPAKRWCAGCTDARPRDARRVFIPIAERTGLIHEIGEWIMRESCRVLALLPSDVHGDERFRRAIARAVSVRDLARALADSGVDNRRIDIEVTGSLLIARDDPALTVISALADQGYSITLDDFGTGYASAQLSQPDAADAGEDRPPVRTSPPWRPIRQAAIVAAILGLSKSLGLEVTAEGVETARTGPRAARRRYGACRAISCRGRCPRSFSRCLPAGPEHMAAA